MINIQEGDLRKMLEEMDVPQNKIDEVISNLPKTEEEDEQRKKWLREQGLYVQHLQDQMRDETDWRKKAAIAAKLISMSLE